VGVVSSLTRLRNGEIVLFLNTSLLPQTCAGIKANGVGAFLEGQMH
jgi:hypothetical protein